MGEIPYPDEEAVSRELFLEEMRKAELLDAPGASVSYSNLGFGLLGVILEEATGLPYEEALRRQVLLPARIWETGYTRAGWGPERLAAGYVGGRRWGTIIERFPAPSGPSWTLVGNGGLHTTAFDAFRFVRAFTAGEIVPPRSWPPPPWSRTRDASRPGDSGDQRYTAPDGTPAVGHDGSNRFLTASLRYLPEHDITLFLAANQAGFTAIDAMSSLLGPVTGQDVPLPPLIDPEPLTDAQRGALTGEWEVGGGRLVVEDGGDHLRIHVEGQALLDRILGASPGLRSLLAADTERARQVVGGAREGDVGRAGALVAVWKAYEERFGPMEEVEVLGSAPVWYYSPRASWLRFHFAGSDRTPVRRLHWSEDGNLTGIGGSVYPAPLTLRCVGTGGGSCTATQTIYAPRCQLECGQSHSIDFPLPFLRAVLAEYREDLARGIGGKVTGHDALDILVRNLGSRLSHHDLAKAAG